MQNKDVSTLSTEELMELAKIKIKEDDLSELPPVQRFILSDGVEQGDYYIPPHIVYDRYITWCEAYNVESLSQTKFFLQLKMYFKKKRTNGQLFYIMGDEGFDSSYKFKKANTKKRKSSDKKEKEPAEGT